MLAIPGIRMNGPFLGTLCICLSITAVGSPNSDQESMLGMRRIALSLSYFLKSSAVWQCMGGAAGGELLS